MKTVYKYKLNQGRPTTLSLPAGYKVLKVGMSHNTVCIWIEVTTEPVSSERLVLDYVGTGWDISDSSEYIGTAFDSDMFVWHVYKENHGNT